MAFQGTGQDLFVADHPVHLRLFRKPDHGFTYGHLGRPHAFRPPAEHALEQSHAELDLALGVLAMREVTLRQLDLRVGATRGVHVADQRQDRVVIRRKGELGLLALGELAIFGDDAADPLQLRGEQDALVFVGEVAILALQLRQVRIVLDPHRVAPGEVEPNLQVADIGDGELGIDRARCELYISRRLLYAQRTGRLAHPAQNEVAFLA